MDNSLSVDETEALRQLARDETYELPTPVLAHLEQLGLVMHAWGQTHVLTQAGRDALASRAEQGR